MDEHHALAPLNLTAGAVTVPFDLLPGQAARPEALDADDQLAALHEAGHAVTACTAATPPFPVSGIEIKSRTPHTALAETDENMPRWHTATRARALLVVDLGGWAAEKALLGEPTSGADGDLRNATTRALALLANGLDPDAPSSPPARSAATARCPSRRGWPTRSRRPSSGSSSRRGTGRSRWRRSTRTRSAASRPSSTASAASPTSASPRRCARWDCTRRRSGRRCPAECADPQVQHTSRGGSPGADLGANTRRPLDNAQVPHSISG